MIYTKEKMAAIRAGIQKAGLSAPQEFFDAGIDELCEVCNGVGGSGLSNDSRFSLKTHKGVFFHRVFGGGARLALCEVGRHRGKKARSRQGI